jgi:isoquinoline 1-oxidoreductase beta subunit
MKTNRNWDRREFLVTTSVAGSGVALGVQLPIGKAATLPAVTGLRINPKPYLPPFEGGVEISPWVVIGPDDRVIIRVAQSEFGNGVLTSNAMMVCEELECDWANVHSVYAEVNRHTRENELYGRMSTGSSGSFRYGRPVLMGAGAEVRERLRLAAAQTWGVPLEEVEVENGVLRHRGTGRTLRYGEMAALAATLPLAATPALKEPRNFKVMGKWTPRLEVPLYVTGEATFGIDVRVPDMLYATVKLAPAFGGKLKSFDFEAIKGRRGVHSAVPIRGAGAFEGVAVVADSWWRAKTAIDAMPIEWEAGPNADVSSETLMAEHHALVNARTTPTVDEGDALAVLERAERVIDVLYDTPYQAAARLEPANCTARVTPDRVDVWVGVQGPDGAQRNAARIAGVPVDQVYVHNHFRGGGFGGGGSIGEVPQAVAIAKTLGGRPVKLLWSREEDTRHHTHYRCMQATRMQAALDADGMPIAIYFRTAGDDGDDRMEFGENKLQVNKQLLRGLSELPYYTPNYRLEISNTRRVVLTGSLRGSGAINNSFFQESFIDELAHAAGKDPYQYRRALIVKNERFLENDLGTHGEQDPAEARAAWIAVLDTVAEKSGWGSPLPRGSARGIAMDDRRTPDPRGCTPTAVVVALTVSKEGKLTLDRVDVAMDTGFSTVNPQIVESQIKGQIAWYFGEAMDEITIRDGGVVQSNFHDYTAQRMADYPKEVGVHLVKSNHWNAGVGDHVTMVAAATCNAIFAATGKRIRSLPISKHDLSWS